MQLTFKSPQATEALTQNPELRSPLVCWDSRMRCPVACSGHQYLRVPFSLVINYRARGIGSVHAIAPTATTSRLIQHARSPASDGLAPYFDVSNFTVTWLLAIVAISTRNSRHNGELSRSVSLKIDLGSDPNRMPGRRVSYSKQNRGRNQFYSGRLHASRWL